MVSKPQNEIKLSKKMTNAVSTIPPFLLLPLAIPRQDNVADISKYDNSWGHQLA